MIKFDLITIRRATGKFIPAFKGKQDSQTNPLERTPNTDTVEISPVKTRTLSANDRKTALKNFNKVKTAKLLNDEIMFLLQPKTNASGEKTFTLNQAKILNAASKKVDFYKEIAKRLEDEGNSNIDTIVKDMKKVFGGEKEYGKYIQARIKDGSPSSKDAKSIYNKLTKEFQEEKLNKEIMNSFSRRLYQKPYKMLDHDEKELVKLSVLDGEIKFESRDVRNLLNVLTTTKKDHEEAKGWIRDLIGIRLVLPDNADMKKVEAYLTNGIKTGAIKVTRVSNYHANHIYPYIKNDTLKRWQEVSPGLQVVSSPFIRKRNGYTTTQINIEHKVKDKSGKEKTVLGELQIRSERLNCLGQIEHLIYDILEHKNISKDIPELKEFYESKGIEKAVNDVFSDPRKESAYLDYERTTYAQIRNGETKHKYLSTNTKTPLLADFGLGDYDVLSFESLDYLDYMANSIKHKYGKND